MSEPSFAFLFAAMTAWAVAGCGGSTNGGTPDGRGPDSGAVGCACTFTGDVVADIDASPAIEDAGATGGCPGGNAQPSQPFGGHTIPYATGTILPSHLSQTQLDGATAAFYDHWKPRYLKTDCGGTHVDSGQAGRMTVSEAHGYGMVLLAFMAGHDPDAHALFDGMYKFYANHPSTITPSLMAWAQDAACKNTDGANSASDGDLDIAYALLLADKQWGSGGTLDYHAAALKILGGIQAGDVDTTSTYTLLGDWASGDAMYYDSTRSSDFMPDHFASFAAATGDARWTQLADGTYGIVDTLQTQFAAPSGLLPDFIASPRNNPHPVPGKFLEETTDGTYSYNACRDPWRIAVDFLVHGNPKSHTAVQRMTTWIRGSTGEDPTLIQSGYKLDGSPNGANFFDRSFVAPFGVAAMVDASNQAWLNSLWDAIAPIGNGTYYDDTITMLSLVAMSGNWWAPEAAPCK